MGFHAPRPLSKPKHILPTWLYNIRIWLALKVTPPDLEAHFVLPFSGKMISFTVCDATSGRPLFQVAAKYFQRPAWSRWNDQTQEKVPLSSECSPE